MALAHSLSTAAPANANASATPPFFRLREASLGYQGPSDDFTNLTEIRIGWFGPTNLDDPLTGDSWWAASLAVREANEPIGGLVESSFSRLTIRLIPRWAVDPWGTGVSQLTRMVYDEQPLALLGSADSAATHLAEQVVAKANLPLVSPIATDKSVTLAGVSWMFSCAPSDDAIARMLGEAIQAGFGSSSNRIVLLAATDHESRMTTREVVSELSRRGRRPDFRFDVPPGAADTARQLQAAAEANPTVVVIIASTEDAARLAQTVRAHLGQVAVFGSHSLGRRRFLELAGSAAEGIRFPLLFAPDSTNAEATRFVARFTSERNHPPDYAAALNYDATRLLIAAIRRAGPNRARIREALTQLSPWSGISGPIHFDGTGQNTRTNLCMATIRGGTIARLPRSSSQEATTTQTAKR